MTRSPVAAALFSAALLALPAAALAQAPPAAPPAFVALRGVVTAASDDSITIKSADGKETVMPLAKTWTVVGTKPVDPDTIKPGSFVATANTNIDAGTGKSTELRVFEPGNKGGEGSRPMAQPNTTMTNATVTKVTKTALGREIDVTYPGGVRHIIVPSDMPVIGNFPLDRSAVKPGVTVVAIGAKGPDGVARGTRIQISEK